MGIVGTPVAGGKTNWCARGPSGRGCPHDGQELLRVQAGASHQGPVHVRRVHQRGGVVRRDASPVLNRKRSGPFLAEPLANLSTNIGMRLLGLVGRGVLSRTDGPDGLIGKDEPAQAFARDSARLPLSCSWRTASVWFAW